MFTLVRLCTLYTSIYPVYPCYPSNTVYPAYLYISGLPMFTLVRLCTLYSLMYILSISFPLYRKSWRSFYAYDQSLSDTRKNFFLHVNDSLSFVNEWLIVRQGLQKLIFVTLLLLSFSLFFFHLINFISYRKC